jgi:hypothetical protein
MDTLSNCQSFVSRQRNKIASIFFVTCFNISYSQNAIFTSNEVGISKIDSTGMMSSIVWTKSRVIVLMNNAKDYVHVFLTNASRSQFYNEVTQIKKVGTAENDIRTFRALTADGDECILILTKNKTGEEEEQLRIYLVDRVYIYNFAKA